MREIRLSGLEGGEPQPNAASLPLSMDSRRTILFNGFPIVQRLSPAVLRQALAWRCFPEPSDAPRKLGTGTIEDNRRTILFNGILFNGCPQPFSDKL
jgi:hypothetical protein